MTDQLREEHIRAFRALSPEERLKWAQSLAWSTFNSLPIEKQQIYLKMKAREKRQRTS